MSNQAISHMHSSVYIALSSNQGSTGALGVVRVVESFLQRVTDYCTVVVGV